MGSIRVHIPDKTEEEFRKIAMKIFGYKKGSLSIAAERAFEEWIIKMKSNYKMTEAGVLEDPVDSIWGMLSMVKNKSGVELQHEAPKIRAQHVFD